MSRPGSRKGKGKKEAAKSPKKVIAELTEENTQLKEQLEQLTQQNAFMTGKMIAVTNQIVNSVNKRDFFITDQTDLSQLTTDVLLEMINKLVVKKRIQEGSVEARTEELETRVTEMSLDIAKLTKKTFAYETGLDDIINSPNLDSVRDKVYQLQFIAGKEYHSFSVPTEEQIPPPHKQLVVNGIDENPNSTSRRMLDNAQILNLIPPSKKFPGETHIRHMHRELRLYLMKELSMQKASGADWRMLAERVGIEADTISEWQSHKLACPMGRVFGEWGESECATVRMLHRHLISPQMRCTLLAKRISDFYDVA